MDWSYIAGFFDGEGNFHINFTKHSLHLVCRIYGNSIPVFEEMIKFMGFGKIYSTEGRTPELIVYKKEEVHSFLKNVSPFLILKKDCALFLLLSYNFDKNNNLDFDLDKFHSYSKRKGKEKSYSQKRKDQIKERKITIKRFTE